MMENGTSGMADDDIQVADDEQYTDKKIKQRILNAREMLTDAQHELYSKRLVDPDVQYSELDALMAWANLVRSYIRDLSILLNHDDIDGAQYYREEVELAQIRMVPPDKGGYEFSQIAYDGVSEDDLLWSFDGFGRGAELPKPRTHTLRGLMSIIETDPVLEERWVVEMNPRAAPPNRKRMQLTRQRPIPRSVYEDALVKADEFLQSAGIGLDIEAQDYHADDDSGPGL